MVIVCECLQEGGGRGRGEGDNCDRVLEGEGGGIIAIERWKGREGG